MSYGGYRLGANSANILVQDRRTGMINEERMSVYVRLGIRLLYKGLKSREMEKKRGMQHSTLRALISAGCRCTPLEICTPAGSVHFFVLQTGKCANSEVARKLLRSEAATVCTRCFQPACSVLHHAGSTWPAPLLTQLCSCTVNHQALPTG